MPGAQRNCSHVTGPLTKPSFTGVMGLHSAEVLTRGTAWTVANVLQELRGITGHGKQCNTIHRWRSPTYEVNAWRPAKRAIPQRKGTPMPKQQNELNIELHALHVIVKQLSSLDAAQRARVMAYLVDRDKAQQEAGAKSTIFDRLATP